MISAVEVKNSGASLTGDEDTRTGVPMFISQHNARIESTMRSPSKVNRGRAKHADALNVR